MATVAKVAPHRKRPSLLAFEDAIKLFLLVGSVFWVVVNSRGLMSSLRILFQFQYCVEFKCDCRYFRVLSRIPVAYRRLRGFKWDFVVNRKPSGIPKDSISLNLNGVPLELLRFQREH